MPSEENRERQRQAIERLRADPDLRQPPILLPQAYKLIMK
jgi:hypothetical protein